MRGFITGVISFFLGSIALSIFCTMEKLIADHAISLEGFLLPVLVGGPVGLIAWIWRRKFRKNRERIDHLNLVMRAIRNVNQLTVKERNVDSLLKGACDNLVETRGYHNAWIAMIDESGRYLKAVEAGLGEEFLSMTHRLEKGELTDCARRSLMQSEAVVTKDPSSECMDCPLSEKYEGRGAMTARLEYDGRVYGILSVSIPAVFSIDEEERDLFKEVAGDIAFALYRIDLEDDHNRAKKAMKRQIKESFAIFNAMDGAVYVADMETHEILAVNRYCEEHYGAVLVGETCYEKLQGGQTGPCPFCTNHLLVGSDGEPNSPVVWDFQNTRTGKWYHCIDQAIQWPDGRLVRMEIAVNITKRKLAEQMLFKNTHELAERIKELNCLYDISRVVEKRDILLLGEIFQEIVDIIPHAWQYPEITCARIILEGQEFKTSNFRETVWGQSSDVIVHGTMSGTVEVYYLAERQESDEGPFQKEERSFINAIARRLGRIAEHAKADKALMQSEKRFRDLVENCLVGILIIQDDLIVYGNPEQERLFGPFPKSFQIMESLNIHPDDVGIVRHLYRRIISGEKQTQSTEFRFCRGSETDNRHQTKWVYCRASSTEYQGKEAILVNMMDITRIKELEHLLRIEDKMTSLGHVAAGIAHEIRNPLSGINIYLSTLEKLWNRVESQEKVKEIIGQVKSASAKIESVIKRVLDFSKPSEPRLVLTDINKPIEEAVNLSSVTLRKSGIRIKKVLDENLPSCYADPHLIEEVILNLITNAAEAMKNMDGAKKIEVISSTKDSRIVIKVLDSGRGVSPDIRDKIFDPFYSTKNGNTGIGLSVGHRIVTDHVGSLDVYTSRWGGAEFVIEIPIEKRRTKR